MKNGKWIKACQSRGRLCTNSEHSRGFLKKVLGGIWRLKDAEWNIKIKEKFEKGLFLTFTFASKSIQSRILTRMPWYLSNGVLILGKMENSNESWRHDLTSFPIWGRAWGVPIDLLTTKNTTRMAAKAGEIITVGNSLQEDTQDDRKELERNLILEDTIQEPTKTIGRATTVSSSPSIASMGENKIEGKLGAANRDTTGEIGREESKGKCDDGNRGKRRIVEDYGDVGYGKMKKSATALSKETQDETLFNIPVFYAQEANILEGSTPFVVGNCSKSIAKENRRKVAVKKDPKAKRGKVETKVASISPMGDSIAGSCVWEFRLV
ncbi:hypothetical protein G4B88_017280 [Cannabis sativa]|uniref:DUF4283 domain-containing protein n=1 Tax=Cannabis sativa TaxID=3483 RepID=A0A7J6HST1_CANSA|nr:hypothetical protein G4B88_017280 [Cannabis sativa]